MTAPHPEPTPSLFAEINRCADRLGRIADLTHSLFSACELESVIREVTLAMVSLRKDAACVVRLVDHEAGGYRLARAAGGLEEGLARVVPFGNGLTHVVAEGRAALLVPNLLEDPRAIHRDWHRSQGLTGYYGTPIEANGEVIGVLSLRFPGGVVPSPEERELIDLFAEHAGLAIWSGQRLLGGSGPRIAVEELAGLGRAMAAAPDPASAGQMIADGVRALLHAQSCGLYRLDPEREDLELTAVSGPVGGARSRRAILAAGTAVAQAALRGAEPAVTLDLLADSRIALGRDTRARLQAPSCRAALALPLMIRRRPLGALVVLDRQGTEFQAEDIRIAQTFADQAALLLENQRLSEQADRASRSARLLADVAREMGASPEPGSVLAHVARAAREATGSDVAGLAVWDPDAGALLLRSRVGALPGTRALSVERGTEPGAEVIVPGLGAGPESAGDPQARERRAAITIDDDGVVTLAVAVPGPRRPVGVLYAARRSRRPFTEEEEIDLRRLGELASVGVGKAELATRERRARTERDAAEQRARDLAESLSAIVWEAGLPAPGGRRDASDPRPFSSVTRRVEGMLGYPVDAWLTQPGFWVRILHPDDRDAVVRACQAAVAEGRDWEIDYRVVAADGRTVWLHEVGRVGRNADGVVERQHGLMVDVTGRKGVEEERALVISAMEQASDAIMITTADGAIEYVNPAFRRLTGYSLSEAVGHTPHLLRSGHERPSFYDDLWATLRAGEVWRGEVVNRRKDGTLFTAQQSIAPLRDERGRITHFVSIAQDISRRKELEYQLLQSQKMEAVGQLAGGVAHDFNNLLTVILGRGDFLLERLGPDDPLRGEVEMILKTAERAGALTQQLLAFSRKQVLQPEVLDLNALVAGMGAMLRRLIGEDIDLRLESDPRLGRVKADPGQIEQVVMNLIVNSRDAMPQGGRLLLETANAVVDGSAVGRDARVPPGQYVTLEVRDTGSGMSPEVQARLFEPFFTTKEMGKGTGLGLSTVYGIVTQHQGHIAVESEPGRGTSFTVYLPRVRGDAPRVQAPAPVGAAAQHAGAILLVEDDAALRAVVREMLTAHGYVVLEASDGEEAIRLGEAQASRLGLLLTDIVMPKLNGPEVAQRLKRSRPGLKILYMSGYPDRGADPQPAPFPQAILLRKPFTPQDLLRRVREALGGATA